MKTSNGSRTDWRQLAILVALVVCIALLWDTDAVYPLRLLVVVFHEFSHGTAALLTGGEIVEIRINLSESGHCLTRGGNPFVIVSAGYIGSMICGATILYATARTRAAHFLSGMLGAILLIATWIWIRPVAGFGFAFANAAGIGLLLLGYHFPHTPNDIALKIIGLTSCLYAPLDIKNDILEVPHATSDAQLLAELTGISTVFWGALWLAASLVIALLTLHTVRVSTVRASKF